MDWFGAGDYEIARQLLQRGVAACFVIGFISAVNQFPALLGEHGLLPVPKSVALVSFRRSPSLFHWRYTDRMLLVLAWSGAALAAALVAGLPQLGPPWLPLLAFLLLEAGFVVAFLGSNEVAPPLTVIVFCRWLLFRLEFGAGMIKIRGEREWRDLTALSYHQETQPMPNPVSWYVHHLPRWFHRGEVIGNHVAKLVVPFFLFAPQPVASGAALIVVLTQLWLVATGNFSWPNAITIVLAATILLLVLGYRLFRNLFARRQLMNASFNRYRPVNAHGAFATVTKEFAPYPLSPDWLIWFLALGAWDTRWFETLLVLLLEGDPATLRLLGRNPFPDAPPRQIRARVYRYRFSTPAEHRASHEWWIRSAAGLLVAPVALAGRARA